MASRLPQQTPATPHSVLARHPHTVAVTVKLVGVIGCSASGKSTASHQLADCLCSPFHPISTDHFFRDDVCEQLGTYDDYRCLDYATIVAWMRRLKTEVSEVVIDVTTTENGVPRGSSSEDGDESEDGAVRRGNWEALVAEEWCRQMLQRLPEAARYARVTSTPQIPLAAAAEAAEQRCGEHINTCDGAAAQKHSEGDDVDHHEDDASLCAHEAEEEDRRRASQVRYPTLTRESCVATEPPGATDADSVPSTVPPAVEVFVVWEGFTLLCRAAVSAELHAALHIECDAETACIRRFFRSPRRHLVQHAISPAEEADTANCTEATRQEREERRRARAAVVARVVRQLYRPRIEQMWSVRDREAQRVALLADLRDEIVAEFGMGHDATSGIDPTKEKDGEKSTTTAADGEAAARALEAAEALLCREVYDCPRPHLCPRSVEIAASGNGAPCSSQANHGDAVTAYWSESGVPTRAFQQFWVEEFDEWCGQCPCLAWARLDSASHPATPQATRGHDETSVDAEAARIKRGSEALAESATSRGVDGQGNHEEKATAALTGKGYVEAVLAERGAAVLQDVPSQSPQRSDPLPLTHPEAGAASSASPSPSPAPLSAALLSSALAPFYYEFRYWFFFEVLYYDRLVSELQRHRLRHRPEQSSVRGASGKQALWFEIDNGRAAQGSRDGALWRQVAEAAKAIRRW